MVSKFNDASKNRSGVVEYHLDKRVQEGTAYTVRGNPELTKALIRSQHRVHKYKSGGLMFDKDDKVTEDIENEIMDSFEQMVFVALDESQYNILWVKHVDKGRVELNFIIVREDLASGKDLDIHSHKRDLPLFNMWKNGINKKYGFADPEANSRKQTPRQRAKAKTKNRDWADNQTSFIAKRANIEEKLVALAQSGRFENRDAMLTFLEKEGYEISRKSAKSFSIKHPELGKRAKRFMDNIIFTDAFQSLDDLVQDMKAPKKADKPIYFRRSLYLKYLDTRRERHLKKYPAPVPEVPEEEEEIEIKEKNEFRDTEITRARDEEERGSRRRIVESSRRARQRQDEVLSRIGQYGADDASASTEAYRGRVSSCIGEIQELSEKLAEAIELEAEQERFEEAIRGFEEAIRGFRRSVVNQIQRVGDSLQRVSDKVERMGGAVGEWIGKPDIVAQAKARSAEKRLLNKGKGSTGGKPSTG